MTNIDWTRVGLVATIGGRLSLGQYQAKLRAAGVDLRLWPGAPGRWIAEDLDGRLYDFAGEERGWERRTPHAGTPPAARAVDSLHAVGTGWPMVDAGGLLRALPS